MRPVSPTLLIRPAEASDPAVARLAALDSRPPLRGPVLVAERNGEPVAAVAVEGGRVVADPFRPTAGVVAVLALHARSTEALAA